MRHNWIPDKYPISVMSLAYRSHPIVESRMRMQGTHLSRCLVEEVSRSRTSYVGTVNGKATPALNAPLVKDVE